MERFVVGTGRCGSTLLSSMLAQHADVVSLNEFLVGLDPVRRFAPGPVSGEALAALIGADQPIATAVLAAGYVPAEVSYPFASRTARHQLGEPMPWLSVAMLGWLTDDPDSWLDELVETARRRPTASMADHYRALFRHLTERAGGKTWIERSGTSIDYVGELAAMYPDARFLHLHRDGCETALSMRDHPAFRPAVAGAMNLAADEADPRKAVRRLLATPPPLWAVGRFWSERVIRGFRTLSALDRDQLMQVRFEDVVCRTADTLGRIAEFFELDDDPDFAARASSLVRGLPPSRLAALTPSEQDELRQACRPGQVLLGRADC